MPDSNQHKVPNCPRCEDTHWMRWYDPPGKWLCWKHGDVIKWPVSRG